MDFAEFIEKGYLNIASCTCTHTHIHYSSVFFFFSEMDYFTSDYSKKGSQKQKTN